MGGILRLRVDGSEVEGSPADIAELLRLRGPQQARLPGPLKDPPTNELLLHEYERDATISRASTMDYLGSVRRLERAISPKSFLDVTTDDVRALERTLLERCKFLGFAPAQSTIPRVRCRQGLFPWSLEAPKGCGSACELFRRQESGPLAVLRGLKHFYGWLQERRLVTEDPVGPVLKRLRATMPEPARGKAKYAPTVEEARELLRAVRATSDTAAVGLVLALLKWGRRPGHVVFFDASGLHLDGTASWGDFEHVRDRVLRRNKRGRSKLHADLATLIAPLDDEFRRFLTEELLPYRARRWRLDLNRGPLFPTPRGHSWHANNLQGKILDPAMRHLVATAPDAETRARWERHLRVGSRERITPGCGRHFFTDRLLRNGVREDHAELMRGDDNGHAIRKYSHWGPADFAGLYRMDNLLS